MQFPLFLEYRYTKEELSEAVVISIIAECNLTKQQDAAAIPYNAILSQFEQDLLRLLKQNAESTKFLELADRLRDVHLWNAGMYLGDRTNAPAMVRPVHARLRAEREQKEAIARQKAEAKQKRELERAKLAEQAKISPKDMFRTEGYSLWDDDGVPTKDKEGADVPKSKTKKAKERMGKAEEVA
jgi:cysteinyl-tRNA synthetase